MKRRRSQTQTVISYFNTSFDQALKLNADYSHPAHLNLTGHNPFCFALFDSPSSTKAFAHVHYCVEVGVLLAGGTKRYHSDHSATVEPGDAWTTSIMEPHGWKDTSAKTRIAVFHVLPEFLSAQRFPEAPAINLLAPFLLPPFVKRLSNPESRSALMSICTALAARPKDRYFPIHAQLALIEILLLLVKDIPEGNMPAIPAESAFTRIGPALARMFDQNRYISGTEAAALCGMSRNYFHAIFKGLMGVSFPRFTMRHRLSQAARELLVTNDPIKAIALRWGFVDASHFYHHFKALYGCLPKAYRTRGIAQELRWA